MPLVVGRVVKCEAVTGKAHLKACSVDVGSGEPIIVVTNCSNVREGTHTVVALLGTELEISGETVKIARTNVGGVYSSGMLCDSPMCGWVGGAAGLCVQVPQSLLPGSPAPSSKPRLDGSAGPVPQEPEVSDKDRKAKEKADRKALAAAKKAARKGAKGKGGEEDADEAGAEAEAEAEGEGDEVQGAAEALGKATLDV